MANFAILDQVHETLAQRVREIVTHLHNRMGLPLLEVHRDFSLKPAAGDPGAIYVIFTRLEEIRDLNHGIARRPSAFQGKEGEETRRFFQAPPLHLQPWFAVTVMGEDARAEALLLGALAASLNAFPLLLSRPTSFLAPQQDGSPSPVTVLPSDAQGNPLPRRPSPSEEAGEEKLSALSGEGLTLTEWNQWLSSHQHPLHPCLQYRVPLRIDSPVESLTVAREVVPRVSPAQEQGGKGKPHTLRPSIPCQSPLSSPTHPR